jgi:predicted metalloprotease
MSRDLDLTELKWSGGQSNAGTGGGGSTEVVLVEGAVVALLVIAFLVYATNASDIKEVADKRQQDRPDSNNAHVAYSAENELGESGGTFEAIESGRSSVKR